MAKKYLLEDVNLRKIESGDEFYIPNQIELGNLKSKDIVKLIFLSKNGENERMWVQINEINDNNSFLGTLVNKPYNIENLNYGDVIEFGKENIIDIYDNK